LNRFRARAHGALHEARRHAALIANAQNLLDVLVQQAGEQVLQRDHSLDHDVELELVREDAQFEEVDGAAAALDQAIGVVDAGVRLGQ
jgi:hypothetical protein